MNKKFIIILLFILILSISACKEQNGNNGDDNIPSNKNIYTVIFDSNGGSNVNKQEIVEGNKIVRPADPTKLNNSFDGWYIGSERVDFNTYIVNSNITIVAKWIENIEQKEYVTVNFNSNGGTNVDSQTVEKGNPLQVISNPTKEGYSFDGWYYGDEKWSFKSDIVLINITLNARWNANTYRVNLNLDGGTGISQSVLNATFDSYIELPTPFKTGYIFDGWYDGSKKIETGTWKISNDITLLAKYNQKAYTITFNLDGGSGLSQTTMNVTYDNSFTLPIVNKDDYTFLGWYNGDEKIDDGIWKKDTNLTLTAKWQSNYVTLTFNSNGGTEVISQTIQRNTKATKPNSPGKAGYVFDGWFVNDEEWNFEENVITSDMTLTANWHLIFKITKNNNEIIITGLNDNSITEIVIPETIDGCVVTNIKKEAFYECSNITSITIPNTVTSIEDSAFNNCTSLANITIPNSVTSIESHAFCNCTSLKSIIIPDSVTGRLAGTFLGCSNLESITMSSKITSIGKWTFEGCTSLTSITIPNGVISLEDCAFSDCTSLTTVKIPDSVTEISYDVFSGCTSLTSITLPNGLIRIDDRAFENCASLESVIIPESVEHIGRHAFSGCSSLKSIIIPKNVGFVGGYAFSNIGDQFIIYCELESKPNSWYENDWNADGYTVIWGYKG